MNLEKHNSIKNINLEFTFAETEETINVISNNKK